MGFWWFVWIHLGQSRECASFRFLKYSFCQCSTALEALGWRSGRLHTVHLDGPILKLQLLLAEFGRLPMRISSAHGFVLVPPFFFLAFFISQEVQFLDFLKSRCVKLSLNPLVGILHFIHIILSCLVRGSVSSRNGFHGNSTAKPWCRNPIVSSNFSLFT